MINALVSKVIAKEVKGYQGDITSGAHETSDENAAPVWSGEPEEDGFAVPQIRPSTLVKTASGVSLPWDDMDEMVFA